MMKRRQFVQIPAVAPILTSTASLSSAATPRKEVLVKAGEDREGAALEFLGATFEVKVSGKDTEGRCVIFDTIRRQKAGPALNLHTDCDEWFFVKSGEFKFRVGDRIFQLKADDSLLVPRETAHAFVKTSDGDAGLIVMHQPAVRMEEYFRVTSKQPDQSYEARKQIAERYGMQFVGPPLTAD